MYVALFLRVHLYFYNLTIICKVFTELSWYVKKCVGIFTEFLVFNKKVDGILCI